MVRGELCRLRTRVRSGGTLIRKTSLLHKIEPTALRSSLADISGISHQTSGFGTCVPIPDPRFLIPDWSSAPPAASQPRAVLGSISSSRCQITCAPFDKIEERANSMFHERVLRPTFAVQTLAPPTKAALAAQVGGARRDRTDDLLLAKQALSQLSYGPFRCQVSVVQ